MKRTKVKEESNEVAAVTSGDEGNKREEPTSAKNELADTDKLPNTDAPVVDSSAIGMASKNTKFKATLDKALESGFEAGMILNRSEKVSKSSYINNRVAKLDGQTVQWALEELWYNDSKGFRKKYVFGDLKYDLSGFMLDDPRPNAPKTCMKASKESKQSGERKPKREVGVDYVEGDAPLGLLEEPVDITAPRGRRSCRSKKKNYSENDKDYWNGMDVEMKYTAKSIKIENQMAESGVGGGDVETTLTGSRMRRCEVRSRAIHPSWHPAMILTVTLIIR